MSEKEIQLFLQQFKLSEKRIRAWPKWMQDASYVATASFLKTRK